MEIILKPYKSGKTTNLIKRSHKNGHTIICQDKSESSRIIAIANKLEFKIPPPITFDEFIYNSYLGKNISGFLIDGADFLLQSLTSIRIKALTFQTNVEKPRRLSWKERFTGRISV